MNGKRAGVLATHPVSDAESCLLAGASLVHIVHKIIVVYADAKPAILLLQVECHGGRRTILIGDRDSHGCG